jgi:hypothetical protein
LASKAAGLAFSDRGDPSAGGKGARKALRPRLSGRSTASNNSRPTRSLYRGISWISGIEKLQKLDELTAAVAILDQGMDLAREQINPGPS